MAARRPRNLYIYSKMKLYLQTGVLLSAALLSCTPRQIDIPDTATALRTASVQLNAAGAEWFDAKCFPRSYGNGEYLEMPFTDWTSGFYPGCLWLTFAMTGDDELASLARHYTEKLSDVPAMTDTHDLGFMVMPSFGLEYTITGDETAKAAVIKAARSLAGRFNDRIGLIRSWDFGDWNYPVIIDNMMNLELLFTAAEWTGETAFRDIAVRHADRTMENHFRSDNSSWHVVSYNDDGSVESKSTWQGCADDSRWARGQAWGLYGYTVCYRFTREPRYLEQAKKIAALITGLPDMPEDKIPYWDYDAPGIPAAARDASAAAVTASALLELQGMVDPVLGAEYRAYAEDILRSLCSENYLAAPGTNGNFILMHSTGAAPFDSEIDCALCYADYYFLEAIQRYKAL